MSTITNWTKTAQIIPMIPSTFGMPTCARAITASGFAAVAKERVKGHVDLAVLDAAARVYVPGHQAWSPPIS